MCDTDEDSERLTEALVETEAVSLAERDVVSVRLMLLEIDADAEVLREPVGEVEAVGVAETLGEAEAVADGDAD